MDTDIEIEHICQDGDALLIPSKGRPSVGFRVSSNQLADNSKYFQILLTNEFLEGSTLRQNGNVEVFMHDDPDAMRILLYILHGQCPDPSQGIGLQLLADIAGLVEMYQLHESVCSLVVPSAKNVQVTDKNAEPNQVIICILCIAWAFSLTDDFELATHRLIVEYGRDLDLVNLETCIPAPLVGGIDYRRRQLFIAIHYRLGLVVMEYDRNKAPANCPCCRKNVLPRLRELWATINKEICEEPSHALVPNAVRSQVTDAYKLCLGGHNVPFARADNSLYMRPECMDDMWKLNAHVGDLIENTSGLEIGHYKENVDPPPGPPGELLDFGRLWPKGEYANSQD